MTDRPDVTVVVPALNAEQWIGDALSSVVAQTYPQDKLEVVVIDDGCTDRTVEEARQVLAPSGCAYSVLHSMSPHGPSAARNRGWRSGRGQWVQFLDADDLLEPEKLSLQMKVASTIGPNVAAIYSAWGRMASRAGVREVESIAIPAIGADALLDILRPPNFMQLGSLILSRAWLERTNGFVESYWLTEDVDLLMRMVVLGGTLHHVVSDRPISWYRQHPGSISRQDTREFMHACVRNLRAAEMHWRTENALTPHRVRTLVELYFGPVRFFAEHDPRAFEEVLGTIEALAPASLPSGPRTLRWLSRLVGYRKAERCAVTYRRLKRLYRGRSSESAITVPAS